MIHLAMEICIWQIFGILHFFDLQSSNRYDIIITLMKYHCINKV